MKDYEKAFKEASEKLPRERLVKCACDCALINIDLIKPYTEKFELIKNFLANPENFDAAAVVAVWAAAANAADAAWAAADAVVAVWAAADAATWAANAADADAYAANAADAAADAYAADAAADAYAAYAAVTAVSDAARISEESKQKVNQLINDMMKEAKEC